MEKQLKMYYNEILPETSSESQLPSRPACDEGRQV